MKMLMVKLPIAVDVTSLNTGEGKGSGGDPKR